MKVKILPPSYYADQICEAKKFEMTDPEEFMKRGYGRKIPYLYRVYVNISSNKRSPLFQWIEMAPEHVKEVENG